MRILQIHLERRHYYKILELTVLKRKLLFYDSTSDEKWNKEIEKLKSYQIMLSAENPVSSKDKVKCCEV